MRVLHLSDVHVDVPFAAMPWREMWWNKRLLGAGNLFLRRGQHFAVAREKLLALAALARDEGVDLVLCTGDYTALGTEPEMVAARAAIAELTQAPAGYVTVPGNHDLYMPDGADGRFERHFGDLLGTDWPDERVDGSWPIVRLCGDDVAVIAVNSARPNPQPWRSSGRIPQAQLDALGRLLGDPRLRGRFVFVMTHYAPRRADGSPDRPSHGMENAEDFLAACAGIERGAVLHGHLHRRFQLKLPELHASIFGAGSTTHAGREGFWLFDVDARRARATPGSFQDGRYVLEMDAARSF